MAEPVYLDHLASTPCDPRVVDLMAPWWSLRHANPHATGYGRARAAARAVEEARNRIAGLVGGVGEGVILTSGATEANNLALLGVASAAPPDRRHILVGAAEHPCVLAAADALARDGFDVQRVPLDRQGVVSPAAMGRLLRPDTLMISLQAASHETGIIQPVGEIARMAHLLGVLVHTDASQAVGRMKFNLGRVGADLVSLSAHKIYGPQGIGALYVRPDPPIALAPRMLGGGQQGGLRAGTVPVALAVGFGEAALMTAAKREADAGRLERLGAQLEAGLRVIWPDLLIHGRGAPRLPGVVCVTVPGLDAESLLLELADKLCLATGAACASARREPAPTLIAMGLSPAEAAASLRLSLGRASTGDDVSFALATLAAWRKGRG